jgi:hypothetical protein
VVASAGFLERFIHPHARLQTLVPAPSTAVSVAACLLIFVLVKRRSSAKSLLEQERRSDSDSARVSLMDDDDVITAVLGQLQQQHGVEAFKAAACVNRQFGRLAALDLFWRELCARRWELNPDSSGGELCGEVEAEIAAAQARAAATEALPQGGAPVAAALWRGAYFKREAELERDYPCFCMPGNLR